MFPLIESSIFCRANPNPNPKKKKKKDIHTEI